MTNALEARVAALEAAVKALEAQPTPPPTEPDSELWVLDGVRTRYPEGAVVFAGTMPVGPEPGSGEIAWQWGAMTEGVREQDWDAAVPIFDALSHPVRLRLLQQVLNGTTTTAELSEGVEMGTTGQLHHHLRALTAAGWLTSTGRGRWAVPPPRVIPLLVLITAATH